MQHISIQIPYIKTEGFFITEHLSSLNKHHWASEHEISLTVNDTLVPTNDTNYNIRGDVHNEDNHGSEHSVDGVK